MYCSNELLSLISVICWTVTPLYTLYGLGTFSIGFGGRKHVARGVIEWSVAGYMVQVGFTVGGLDPCGLWVALTDVLESRWQVYPRCVAGSSWVNDQVSELSITSLWLWPSHKLASGSTTKVFTCTFKTQLTTVPSCCICSWDCCLPVPKRVCPPCQSFYRVCCSTVLTMPVPHSRSQFPIPHSQTVGGILSMTASGHWWEDQS